MRGERMRWVAVMLFAIGAVLVGLGNEHHSRGLTAGAFIAFGLGVIAFVRWKGTA